MKYRNTKTGAETNQFSEADWKSGLPQRMGWVDTAVEKPLKAMPKDIVDFVFKKKAKEEPIIIETSLGKTVTISDVKKVKQSKPKQNDHTKQKRPAAKRKH